MLTQPRPYVRAGRDLRQPLLLGYLILCKFRGSPAAASPSDPICIAAPDTVGSFDGSNTCACTHTPGKHAHAPPLPLQAPPHTSRTTPIASVSACSADLKVQVPWEASENAPTATLSWDYCVLFHQTQEKSRLVPCVWSLQPPSLQPGPVRTAESHPPPTVIPDLLESGT